MQVSGVAPKPSSNHVFLLGLRFFVFGPGTLVPAAGNMSRDMLPAAGTSWRFSLFRRFTLFGKLDYVDTGAVPSGLAYLCWYRCGVSRPSISVLLQVRYVQA